MGLRTLEIDCGLTPDGMEAATLETIGRNRHCFADGRDFQIVHNVSRGPMGLYETVFEGGVKPTVTINCWPLTWHLAAFAETYGKGVHAVIPTQRSVPSRLIDPQDQEPEPDLLPDCQLAGAEGGSGGVGAVDG